MSFSLNIHSVKLLSTVALAASPPSFNVTFHNGCSEILFNGTAFRDGKSGNFTAGNYTATADIRNLYCPISDSYFIFSRWNTTGGVSISNAARNPTNVTISGNGTLSAISHLPLVSITPPMIFLVGGLLCTIFFIRRRGMHPLSFVLGPRHSVRRRRFKLS